MPTLPNWLRESLWGELIAGAIHSSVDYVLPPFSRKNPAYRAGASKSELDCQRSAIHPRSRQFYKLKNLSFGEKGIAVTGTPNVVAEHLRAMRQIILPSHPFKIGRSVVSALSVFVIDLHSWLWRLAHKSQRYQAMNRPHLGCSIRVQINNAITQIGGWLKDFIRANNITAIRTSDTAAVRNLIHWGAFYNFPLFNHFKIITRGPTYANA